MTPLNLNFGNLLPFGRRLLLAVSAGAWRTPIIIEIENTFCCVACRLFRGTSDRQILFSLRCAPVFGSRIIIKRHVAGEDNRLFIQLAAHFRFNPISGRIIQWLLIAQVGISISLVTQRSARRQNRFVERKNRSKPNAWSLHEDLGNHKFINSASQLHAVHDERRFNLKLDFN